VLFPARAKTFSMCMRRSMSCDEMGGIRALVRSEPEPKEAQREYGQNLYFTFSGKLILVLCFLAKVGRSIRSRMPAPPPPLPPVAVDGAVVPIEDGAAAAGAVDVVVVAAAAWRKAWARADDMKQLLSSSLRWDTSDMVRDADDLWKVNRGAVCELGDM